MDDLEEMRWRAGLMTEAEVVDFNKRRQEKLQAEQTPKPVTPPGLGGLGDTLKYDAAVRQQQGGSPNLNDIARDLVAKNWHHVVAGRAWPDEERAKMKHLLTANTMIIFWKFATLMREKLQAYNKSVASPDRVSYQPGMQEFAYVNDDPDEAKWGYMQHGQKHLFNNRIDADISLYQNVLQDMPYTPEEQAKIDRVLALAGEPDWAEQRALDPKETFDPESRPSDTEFRHSTQRLIKRLEKLAEQNQKHIYFERVGHFYDRWAIRIMSEHYRPIFRRRFESRDEMEEYLIGAQEGLRILLTTRAPEPQEGPGEDVLEFIRTLHDRLSTQGRYIDYSIDPPFLNMFGPDSDPSVRGLRIRADLWEDMDHWVRENQDKLLQLGEPGGDFSKIFPGDYNDKFFPGKQTIDVSW